MVTVVVTSVVAGAQKRGTWMAGLTTKVGITLIVITAVKRPSTAEVAVALLVKIAVFQRAD